MDNETLRLYAIGLFRGIDCPEFQVALEKKCYGGIIAVAPLAAWERFWGSDLPDEPRVAYNVLSSPSTHQIPSSLTTNQVDRLVAAIATNPLFAAGLLISYPGPSLTPTQISRLVEMAITDIWASSHILTYPQQYPLTADQVERLVATVSRSAIAARQLLAKNYGGCMLTTTQLDRLMTAVTSDCWEAAILLITIPADTRLSGELLDLAVAKASEYPALASSTLAYYRNSNIPYPFTPAQLAALQAAAAKTG